jgi:RHS repeat-associated protein
MLRSKASSLSGRPSFGALALSWVALACGAEDPGPSAKTQPAAVSARQTRDSAQSAKAKAALAAIRARTFALPPDPGDGSPIEGPHAVLENGLADRFESVAGGLMPHFPAALGRTSARVFSPALAKGAFRLEDAKSGMSIEVSLAGAGDAKAEVADGYVVYARAHASGATLLHRARPDGLEDFLSFDARPASPEVVYQVALRHGVAGLRLVSETLEFLDKEGASRLRVAPPYLIGADGTRTDARLTVEDCAVSANPGAAGAKRVTPAGAERCAVRVSWTDHAVAYPALLDPRWTTTTETMEVGRHEHTATLLPNGKVLVVGGRTSTSSTVATNSSELYNPANGTWSVTATTMAGNRRLHTATLLNNNTTNPETSGRVLVAGGVDRVNSTETSTTTTRLYNPANETWTNGTALNAARHGHTATLLADGRVFIAGGMNGSAVLPSTATYAPAQSGATWLARANMASNRRFHTAVRLSTANTAYNNLVLIVGGNSGNSTSLNTVQLFSQASNAFVTTPASPNMTLLREGHTATALANGNVLIAGGKSGSTLHDTTLVFEIPTTGSAAWFTRTAAPRRVGHSAALLPAGLVAVGGKALVAGGSDGSAAPLSSADLWDPIAKTWGSTNALPAGVQGHTATVFGNGAVLIAGGTTGSTVSNLGRVYDATFAVVCTSNTQCASGFCADGVCCDGACSGDQCRACNVPGSVGICSPKVGAACNDGSPCTQFDVCQANGTCQGPIPVTCQALDSCHDAGACDAGKPAAVPPVLGRIGWWKLDGDGADASGGNHPLTNVGNVATAPGRFGLGIRFDGSSCMTAPIWAEARLQGTPGITMMAWVNTGDALPCPSGFRTLLGRGWDYMATGVCFGPPDPNIPGLAGDIRAVGDEEVGPGGPWAFIHRNAWTHVAVTWDHQDVKHYVNGQLGTSRANPGNLTDFDPMFAIGCRAFGGGTLEAHFIGTIDEAVLYNRPLTDDEIRTYYRGADPCTHPVKQDGADCSDGNSCTQTDQCQAGACTGTNPVVCAAANDCQLAGTCNPATGACSNNAKPDATACTGGIACPANNVCEAGACGTGTDGVCLRADGVVDEGNGQFVAIFGHNSSANASVRPDVNEVRVDGEVVSNPYPAPPVWLAPESHPGSFLPTFEEGQSVSWHVDGQMVTASATPPFLEKIPRGSGYGVQIGDDFVMVRADLDPWTAAPEEPVAQADPQLGPKFLGVLSGELQVTPSGAARFTVPIKTSPGTMGMEPKLSLVYDSQGGNGIAGQGWHLAGLSTIHRCPKTRVQDGIAQPVLNSYLNDVDNGGELQDGLCIDGTRLFRRPGTQCGRAAGDACYEPEVKDFSTITADAEHTAFKVVTRTGETRYYGRREAARVRLIRGEQDHSPPDNEPQIAVWALDRVMDAWGNYYDVEYNDCGTDACERDFDERGLIVTAIRYTGRVADSGGSSAAQPPTEFVQFTYEHHVQNNARRDIRHRRFHRGTIPQNRRLSTIQTKLGTYILSYMPDSDPMLPSLLKSIDYCGGEDCWTGDLGAVPQHVCTDPDCAPLPATVDERRQRNFLEPLVFDWEGGGYRWEPSTGYRPPARIDATYPASDPPLAYYSSFGTQFVDLNGDGRVEFVQNTTFETEQHAWENTGSGWSIRDNWKIPAPLRHGAGARDSSTMFVDVDADGISDIVTSTVNLANADPGAQLRVWLNRINRNRNCAPGACWQDLGLSTPAPGLGAIDFRSKPLEPAKDTLIDMNGDGRADLVRMDPLGDLRVVLRTETGWAGAEASEYQLAWHPAARLIDLNRDGLPDAFNLGVRSDGFVAGRFNLGAGARFDTNGNVIAGSAWSVARLWTEDLNAGPPGSRLGGDIDGDGLYDSVTYKPTSNSDCGPSAPPPRIPYFTFATGQGFDPASSFQMNQHDSQAINYFPLNGEPCQSPGYFSFINLSDLNGDGLSDLVITRKPNRTINPNSEDHPGNLLVNTGNGWRDDDGEVGYPNDGLSNPATEVPEVPSSFVSTTQILALGRAFIDLDGDGILDLVKHGPEGPSGARAWLNRFKPPIITKFPNGLARKTEVSYVGLTTPEARQQGGAYRESGTLEPGTTFLSAPLRVVASVSAEDGRGIGELVRTTYAYEDLRGSASGRGPQGFKLFHVVVPGATAQERSTVTTTAFRQAYPYTGLPYLVSRYKPGTPFQITLTQTRTDYCDTQTGDCTAPTGRPPGQEHEPETSLFVYAKKITDFTQLNDGIQYGQNGTTPPHITVTSEFAYDDRGNPTLTTVETAKSEANGAAPELYRKTTENTYGAPGSREQRLGKVTRSVVTTENVLVPEQVVQTTESSYSLVSSFFADGVPGSTLALTKLELEPGATAACLQAGGSSCEGLETHTAYDYDRYGNVTITTVCASDFDECEPDAENPSTPADPLSPDRLAHPPFRTTVVSYDPSDFTIPNATSVIDTLDYAPGRFPVRKENAAGHVEYYAYDPFHGALRQRTDPNGIHTCIGYDVFGQQTREISRCGATPTPLLTTTDRHWAISEFPDAKVVTVTREPTGKATWSYTNVLGRETLMQSRAFGGRLVESTTAYDILGRVRLTVKPHLENERAYHTVTAYDHIGRPGTITDQIGPIDGANDDSTSLVTMHYEGSTVRTRRVVNGAIQERSEKKNALGKVASIKDANGKTTTFLYDPEGRLTRVTDPLGNVTGIGYDGRGRKRVTDDPDLGHLTYDYDGFGDLIRQNDAKLQTTRMTYDGLGRLRTRTDRLGMPEEGTAEWFYDDADGGGIGRLAAVVGPPDPRLTGSCAIPHVGQTSGNRAGRWFVYDAFGSVTESNECVDGTRFITNYQYDNFGRQEIVRYPSVGTSRFEVRYNYTERGFLHFLTDEADDKVLWAATEMNALGQVTREYTRNGVETVSNRNKATGWLMGRTSTAHANDDDVIQNWAYRYDEVGNQLLRARLDLVNGSTLEEFFTYDPLNRLQTARTKVVTPGTGGVFDETESYAYDDIGNLTFKDDKTYSYTGCMAEQRPAGPHAVCSVTGSSPFVYDGNGNMRNDGERTITYDATNKVRRIELDGTSTAVDFVYGAEGNRVVQLATANGSTTRTIYVGLGGTGKSLYERTTRGGVTEHVQFVYAGSSHDGNAFALRVTRQDASGTTPGDFKYYHFDHLGSVTAMSDDQGVVLGDEAGPDSTRMSYDAWGARRAAQGLPADPSEFNLQVGRREFTSHETIPNVGLVNMNGRVYSPALGRFLSADPNVQFVGDPQSYNRYTYALNNPLRYTDPTGYFINSTFDTFVNLAFTIGAIVCEACAPGFAIAAAIYNAASQLNSGVAIEKVALSTFVTISTEAVKAYVASTKGSKPVHLLAAGAVSQRVSESTTRFVSTATLGDNLLGDAAEAADWAGGNAANEASGRLSAASDEQPAFELEQADALRKLTVYSSDDPSQTLLVATKIPLWERVKLAVGNLLDSTKKVGSKAMEGATASIDPDTRRVGPRKTHIEQKIESANQGGVGKLRKGGGKLPALGPWLMVPEILEGIDSYRRSREQGKTLREWINETPTDGIFVPGQRKLGTYLEEI